jgi:hypothetical protein
MNNQMFERTVFSDEIFAIFGRVLTVATRFDSSTKTLARLPLFKVSVLIKYTLDDDEYEEMVQKISKSYTNLNRAIQDLQLNQDIKDILHQARLSRNELIHEATLGATKGFDLMDSKELSEFLKHIAILVLQVIKGESMILTIISILNKEPVSDYLFSKEYEVKYVTWVMKRFET